MTSLLLVLSILSSFSIDLGRDTDADVRQSAENSAMLSLVSYLCICLHDSIKPKLGI
jgi:hypothetical protein